MRALCTEIFEHIFSEELSKEVTRDFSGREKDVEGEITHILYHLKDSRPYIKSILSCEGGEMFMRYFKEYLSSLFAGELMKHKSEVPQEYMLNHAVCDFTETVRWWMDHPEYSAEDISRFFFATTPLQ